MTKLLLTFAAPLFLSNLLQIVYNMVDMIIVGHYCGSGNYRVNFAVAILDGIVLRIGLALLLGLGLHMGYMGFWFGDALTGYTPFVIGLVYYFTGAWKTRQYVVKKS